MRILLLSVVLVAVVGCRGSGADSNVLLRVKPEMAGARCASGGLAVQSGLDSNGNGTLDDDEVIADNTQFICNGANGTNGMNGMDGQPGAQGDAGTPGTPGVNALSQLTAELPGTNCQYGGSRVDVGLDTNANGTLDMGEITSTRYICDRASVDSIYFGDVRLRDQDDLDQLVGIQVIVGNVAVENIPNGMLALPQLRIISGELRVGSFCCGGGGSIGQAPVPLTSISLPALTQLGSLYVTYTSALTTISVPALERANSVDVTFNGGLTTLTAPNLERVNSVRIESNDTLTGLAFTELVTTESFRVGYNDALTTLTAPALRAADTFEVQYNSTLSACAVYRLVSALATQPSYVQVVGNDVTTMCMPTDSCRRGTVAGVTGTIWSCFVSMPFDTARTHCTSIGANTQLLWAESDAEWTALVAAMRMGEIGRGWIGYSDATTEGTWTNFASSTYDPTTRMDFWSFSEPNGGTAENAAEWLASGSVNDLAATSSLPFVCRAP
ncbi:MAG: hypothetical protein JNM17_29530 [Archangium sp.]|nr:hypothetical protein [Archangium sp.]